MRYLMVLEKPSLMKEVKACYFNHKAEVERNVGQIDFVTMAGHLCTNFLPDDYPDWKGKKWDEVEYPMIPSSWGIKPIQQPHSLKLLNEIKSKISSYDGYIVGTDSDTEGYGIYYLLEQYLGMDKKPALRFMEHSLTDKELLKSFLTMTDFHKDPSHVAFTQSFLVRSRADWLYGMNISRKMSVATGEPMHVGRVKAPTIKLVYDNSMAIENFKPEKYWQLVADYGDGFTATLINEKGQPVNFDDPSKVPSVPLPGVVSKKEAKITKTHAPKLYDLAAVQIEAGQRLGINPQKTLDILQSLYETHKILSYPRTQCRFVSSEKAKEFPDLLEKVAVFPDLKPYVDKIKEDDIKKVYHDKSVVNDKEVEKESHDALLPTSKMPDLSKLSKEEYDVCHLIYMRLLAQFMDPLTEEKTKLVLNHNGYLFAASGKVVIDLGWRKLYGQLKDNVLPPLKEGDPVKAEKIAPAEKVTTPPKRLTVHSLLNSMMNIANLVQDKQLRQSLAESKGIGTPATRSAIVQDIIEKGYIEDKKGLYITPKGKAYVESLGSVDIISPIFAAQMDYKIKKVQRREISFDEAYQSVTDDLYRVCKQIDQMDIKRYSNTGESTAFVCPECGKNLKSMKYSFQCDCGVNISKTVAGKKLTDNMVAKLLDGEKLPSMTFKSNAGKSFTARLYYSHEKKDLAFDFSSGIPCPFCGKDVTLNRGGAFCECGLKVFKNTFRRTLTDREIKTVLKTKKLPKSTFPKKDGGTYETELVLDPKEKTLTFPPRK